MSGFAGAEQHPQKALGGITQALLTADLRRCGGRTQGQGLSDGDEQKAAGAAPSQETVGPWEQEQIQQENKSCFYTVSDSPLSGIN